MRRWCGAETPPTMAFRPHRNRRVMGRRWRVSGFVSAPPTSCRLRRHTRADEIDPDVAPDQLLWPTGTTQRPTGTYGRNDQLAGLITRRPMRGDTPGETLAKAPA